MAPAVAVGGGSWSDLATALLGVATLDGSWDAFWVVAASR